MKSAQLPKPTSAFVGASWAALFLGAGAYLIGLWNADMQLNEKGYYFTLLLFGLFSSVSLQKSVRDKLEGIKVTAIYYGLSWFSLAASVGLLAIGLFNATLALSEKGFYAMAFSLCLFAAIAVQKNTRDMAYFEDEDSAPSFDSESTDEA
ncbi:MULTISPECIES: inner membrane protein YiaA [unclassified Agarivorans]|uniref:inner membrane protein YiaA n=1 Tax=unclassified Agarivorans TaxID=2636026 RepID=UPI0026E20D16|nr:MULTISPECIES: inner membrane protein YiaA [unclassified Agarivorans]MDO6686499.1 inner membrane protein YiaA [Agarivorans sp. 3_MG-2023]MDO6715317.1 inner membrane protein YiaA [Agarivorans sp. 2_MG-2023]MDO6763367.1 inner membrane protein YiaA [Agarivorans sp. 1_MG-2023]